MKTALLGAFGALLLLTQPGQPALAAYKSQAELTAALAAGQATPDMLTSDHISGGAGLRSRRYAAERGVAANRGIIAADICRVLCRLWA
jgi:hypothetical protein